MTKAASSRKDSKKKVLNQPNKKNPEYATEKRKLDDIFKSLRHKSTVRSQEAETVSPVTASTGKASSSVSRLSKPKETYKRVVTSANNRKHTEDNLPVYTIEELNIGKGGNTSLCPFDCDCCY
ncbi:uncharacterized protein BBOV_IV002890 [Babesia bovis T2Bo]|uniref:DUF1764 domain-containing protein n=1 Tax=Babesia bovis TaxID=5865 RepID=A7AVR0_BABBO|nr:uncharacterized protein BBOV_IV002890 [Babesia bovis T2Bo]EDO05886.1 hypothetical protein BBOV_IV002890 [Babesia bovis T2Bo]|eukprot:XP_001609454.1 hypothetical protein [Babesia bovis T2Bo]